jgi:hypothetical protein
MPVAAGAAIVRPMKSTPIRDPMATLVRSKQGAQTSNFRNSSGTPT